MRSTQSSSIDYNQMLVVSVFFHFFLFTVVMFLPHSQKIIKRIKPAFMVSFVNAPTGPEMRTAPPAKETPVAPVPQKTPVVEKPVPQKPKPVQSAANKALVSKLEQLTQMKKKVVTSKPSVLDDTFQDLESVKKKQIPKKEKLAMAAPKPVEDVLEGFADIKMKTTAEKRKKPTRKKIAKEDLTLKELEFEHLSKKTAANRPKDKPKKSSDLFKDLDDLNKMNQTASAALDKPKTQKSRPESKASQLLKQLESIKKESVQIKIDTSKLSAQHSTKFKSEIRSLKMAEIQKQAAVASGEPGDPGADVISKYVGDVYTRVYAHWKDPLGGGTGMVQVSFSIFPRGNIAMPRVVKSSGDSKLDNLAIRAIKNAVPLPPFPKEIKEPNLPLIFEFTYVPSNS